MKCVANTYFDSFSQVKENYQALNNGVKIIYRPQWKIK